MATDVSTPSIAPEIRTVLRGLRWRIRAYIWLEGLATAVNWLALMFWLLLALDYSPVLVWASELPRAVRSGALVVTATVLLWILYDKILARAFVRLRDRSLAVLLERRFPRFGDSLVTSVELARHPDLGPATGEMLAQTRDRALAELPAVQLGTVFRRSPLVLKAATASLLLASIVLFATWQRDAFALGMRRLYLLEDEPWPRSAQVEIVGIEVERISPRTGELVFSETVPFVAREVKVARGATVALRVRANTQARRTPEYCRIYYRTQDGTRGQVTMRRDGAPNADDFQYYYFSGKPFQGILEDLRFDVVGYDHRVRDHAIRIVDTPAIVETVLECRFPEYLVDPQRNQWLPRREEYRSSGTQLPKGTRVTIRMTANKDLAEVEFYEPGTSKLTTVRPSPEAEPRTVQYVVEDLRSGFALDVALRDRDNVLSDSPHRVFLAALDDTPPQLELAMRGVGTAVTPDVQIPVTGTIKDDHGLADSWFEYQVNGQEAQRQPIAVAVDDQVVANLDFRELRIARAEAGIQPGDKLVVAVKAADRYNLDNAPNVGSGDRLEAEVVTPDELLIRLDRRELAERRRFEHVLEELTQMRDSLIRVQNEVLGISSGADPADALEGDNPPSATADPNAEPESRIDLRGLRVQQAQRQVQKSRSEVLGIAAAFFAIRDELVNNRIDAEDRKSRLQERVANPLQQIGETRFPQLEARLTAVATALTKGQQEAEAVEASIADTNELLVQLNQVLEAMLDIESFNELVEIVRSLIEEQQQVLDETKKARKKEALELLQ